MLKTVNFAIMFTLTFFFKILRYYRPVTKLQSTTKKALIRGHTRKYLWICNELQHICVTSTFEIVLDRIDLYFCCAVISHDITCANDEIVAGAIHSAPVAW